MLKRFLTAMLAALLILSGAACDLNIHPKWERETPEPVTLVPAPAETAVPSTPAPTELPRVFVENRLGFAVSELYISPALDEEWGVAAARLLESGSVTQIEPELLSPSGGQGYDIGAIDENGVNYDAFGVALTFGDRIMLTGDWQSGMFTVFHADGSRDFYKAKVYWNEPRSAELIPISASKTGFTVDSDEGETLGKVEYNRVYMSSDTAQRYPKLAEALAGLFENRRAALTEFVRKSAETAGAEGEADASSEPPIYTETVRVCRSDDVLVSLLFETSRNGERVMAASACFDPKTGEELHAADIVTDVMQLPHLINTALKAAGSELQMNEYRDYTPEFSNGSKHFAFALTGNELMFIFNENAFRSGIETPVTATIALSAHPFIIKPVFLTKP